MNPLARRAAGLVGSLLALAGIAACAAGEEAVAGSSDTALVTVADAGKGRDAAASPDSSRSSSGGFDASPATDPADTGSVPDLDAAAEASDDASDDAPVDDDAGPAEAAAPVDAAPPPPPPPPVDAGPGGDCPNNPSYDIAYAAVGFIPGATKACSTGCTSSQCCYKTHNVCLSK